MADLETAPPVRFRYRRLKYSDEFEEKQRMRRRRRRSMRWFRIGRALRLKLKLIKIPSLKKSLVVTAMRASISKVLKRFRDGEAHFGDLFAGNYLFVQVNPSSLSNASKIRRCVLPNFAPPLANKPYLPKGG